MTSPTPRDATPALEQRKQLVADAMDSLDGVAELTTPEQLARLDEVQGILAAVLNNQDVNQLGIPGVHGQP
ncbi:hypothetical protein GCM10028820_08760 [Tessaracoccus terricola]